LCHFFSKRLEEKWHNWYSTARFLYNTSAFWKALTRLPQSLLYQLCHFSSKRLEEKWHNWYSTARFLYTTSAFWKALTRLPQSLLHQLCHFSSKRLEEKWHNWYSTAPFLYRQSSPFAQVCIRRFRSKGWRLLPLVLDPPRLLKYNAMPSGTRSKDKEQDGVAKTIAALTKQMSPWQAELKSSTRN